MSVLKLVVYSDEVKKDVIATLERMLEIAKSGKAIGCSGIIELEGSTYQQFGTKTMSRLQTAGALLELAIERLNRESDT